jgi:hypothetical protein
MASHQDTDVLATECEWAILDLYGSWANVGTKTKAAYDLLCSEQPTCPSVEHRICLNQFGFDWDNARRTFVRLGKRASAQRRASAKRRAPSDLASERPTKRPTPPGSVRNSQCTLQDLQDEAAKQLGVLRAEERLAKVTEERDDALKNLEELRKDNSRVKELEQENAQLGKFLRFSRRLANVYHFGAQSYWFFLRTAIQENGLTHVKPPPPIPRTGDQKADASRFFFDVKDYAKDLGCEVTRKERTYEVVRASSSDKS